MRSRRQTPQQQEAIARRLALLSAELAGVRSEPARESAEPTAWRPADPELAAAYQPWDESEVTLAPDTGADSYDAQIGPTYPGRHAARRRGPSLAAALPETVRRRWALGPAHIAVLAVIVAFGLGLTAWWAVRSQPREVAQPADLITGVPPSESPLLEITPESAGPDSATELVVDVSGKVRRPGIAVLEPGARVVDALKAAGGARRGADLGALNLARPVVDGEQILVGVPPPSGIGAAAAGPSGGSGPLVNINIADQPELETLPGDRPRDRAGDHGVAHGAQRFRSGRGTARRPGHRRGDAGSTGPPRHDLRCRASPRRPDGIQRRTSARCRCPNLSTFGCRCWVHPDGWGVCVGSTWGWYGSSSGPD